MSMDPVFGPRTSFATLADGTVVVHDDNRYTVSSMATTGGGSGAGGTSVRISGGADAGAAPPGGWR